MTTERSDAYITQADMEGNWDRSAERRPEDFSPEEKEAIDLANAEKLAQRLVKYCTHGGRMEALPGLPHAVAVRFDPVEEEAPNKKIGMKDAVKKETPKETPEEQPLGNEIEMKDAEKKETEE